MPSLAKHHSNDYIKLLFIGDSKSGKTGALTSLVKAGYKLRVLDWDNGLDVLKQFVLRDCPSNLDAIEFRSLRDKRKAGPGGPILDGPPKAFVTGLKMMDKWVYKTDDGEEINYGEPKDWGPDTILVLDSLTFMSDAAYDWAETITVTGKSGDKDARAVYGNAQDAVEKVLALLTSESYRTNVIVISHVKYIDNPDGSRKGYPTAIGQALSPVIPRYFNTVVLCQTNPGGKRTLQTKVTPMIDLANPKPFEMKDNYPIETGLADIFKVLKGELKPNLKLASRR